MSALAVQAMTEQEATKLTERIRLTAHNYAEARIKLQELVAEAKDGNAHVALGYASWTAYLSDVLGEEPMRLARSERQEMVQLLSAEGMSTRAIAGTLSISKNTVTTDLSQVGTPEPAPVTGMDGKTYARPEVPEAAQPKRPPLPEQYFNTVYDLGKILDRLTRLTEDDRFGRNQSDLKAKHQHDLERHQATLTNLINKLSS